MSNTLSWSINHFSALHPHAYNVQNTHILPKKTTYLATLKLETPVLPLFGRIAVLCFDYWESICFSDAHWSQWVHFNTCWRFCQVTPWVMAWKRAIILAEMKKEVNLQKPDIGVNHSRHTKLQTFWSHLSFLHRLSVSWWKGPGRRTSSAVNGVKDKRHKSHLDLWSHEHFVI